VVLQFLLAWYMVVIKGAIYDFWWDIVKAQGLEK